LQEAANPIEGSAQNAMLGVSCATSTSCMAVGEAAGKPVAQRWNGNSWSRTTVPLPSGASIGKLASVSCSDTVCFAVGYSAENTGAEKALVENWDGTSWSIGALPAPADALGYVNLTSVSCLSPRACSAGGYYASG